MKRSSRWIVGSAAAVSVILGGTAIAVESAREDDQPLSGSTFDKATAAALEHTGGGAVTDTEMGDDSSTYSVEVRLPDGTQVEVDLDRNFRVLGQELDDDS